MLRVAGLVPYPLDTAPSQRFRLEQWRPVLEQRGVLLELMPYADERLMEILHHPGQRLRKAASVAAGCLRRGRSLAGLRAYDAVVVHRAACLVGPAVLERFLARTGRPLIFDFDDAIYLLHTTEANRGLGWLKFPGKTAAVCRLSDHVVTANATLAAWARGHNPRVTVIPSSVDTERYRPGPSRAPDARVVIGWTGSSTSMAHLEGFAPVLREVIVRGVELHVHCDRRPRLGDVPFVYREWRPDTEVEELSAFDIGIMPMPDEPWSRGKSAMKALLYMAMGIPAVCSAVGMNCEVVRHGQNGLLARTPEDWIASLRTLVADADLRQRLGKAGRRTVEDEYSRERSAGRFAAVIEAVLASPMSQS